MKETFYLSLFFIFCVFSTVWAETISLKTYYPAPIGSYERFRLVPRTPLGSSCQIGTFYVETPDLIQFCQDDGTGTGTEMWGPLVGVWRQGIDAGGDPVVHLTDNDPNIFVGIGTTEPTQKLEVAGLIEADNISTRSLQSLFMGEGAGVNNTTGHSNVFVGKNAGINHISGLNSTLVGAYAGESLVSNTGNTFIGHSAGQSNAFGGYNTFIGTASGTNTTSGRENAFLGCYTGLDNTFGSYSVHVGYAAGESTTTTGGNTFLGSQAGNNNSTGSFNVMVGKDAGVSNVSGRYNTYVGYNAGVNNVNGDNNALLGGDAGDGLTSGSENVYIGYQSGHFNLTGSGNVFVGYRAGYNETGSNKLYIANSSANPPLIYGEFDNLRVGIGTTTPGYTLDVNGEVHSAGYLYSSDERLKKNFAPIMHVNDKLKSLRGLHYQWKESGEEDIGVIAQDVEKVFPELVTKNPKTGIRSVKYGNLVAPLIEAVKERQNQIEVLKKRILLLEERLEDRRIN